MLSLPVILLSLLALQPVLGFFPTKWKEVVFGFGGTSHVEMTEDVFEERAKAYFPLVKTLTSKMSKARDEIADANADVDDNQTAASWHCDGESFPEAKTRIATLKQEAIAALQAENASLSRHKVGEALHTIQDFYSHSNWVELGNTGANLDLIRDGDMSSYTATFEETTCSGCSFTLLDPFCQLFNCDATLNGFTKLTSGYYHGEDTPPAGVDIPSHKCHHGGYTDTPLGSTIGFLFGPPNPGINKDSLNCDWSPHWKWHARAVAGAKEATKQFFDDIKAEIDEHALRLLFGVGPTLAFAIDTTGSMSAVISTARSIAISIAESRVGTLDEPSSYVVSPFNDPGTGPLTVTSSLDTFKSTVNGLFASGGGDCPELIITGMLDAVNAMEKGATLFAFTDAAPKDIAYESQLLSTAVEKNLNIYILKFDSDCDDGGAGSGTKLKTRKDSLSDLVYSEICAATGGQYFSGPVSDVRNITDILDTLITGDISTILRIQDSVVGDTKTYTIPVDSYMTKVTFSLQGVGIAIMVAQPDGSALGTDGVTRTVLSDSEFISIKSPMMGSYTVTVSGTGSFSLISQGVSTLRLSRFNFASVRGRPGHTGWYPISGPPPYNQRIGAIADMAGPFSTATFSFRQPSFAPIGEAAMTAGSGEKGFPPRNSFFNILQVPEQSFFVYVSGTDDKGLAYQRVVDTITVPIFSNVTFPLAGNQTFPVNNSTSSSSSATPTVSTSHWSNSSTIATSSTGPWSNSSASATSPVYTTSTVYSTKVYAVTSCSPGVPHCPGTVATEVVPVSVTTCAAGAAPPASVVAYTTKLHTVTACPNEGGTKCADYGRVETRTIPIPVVPATGGGPIGGGSSGGSSPAATAATVGASSAITSGYAYPSVVTAGASKAMAGSLVVAASTSAAFLLFSFL
ncbi:uncharacterized protein B0I36DRAFT_34962 [Microdochium trichocladiopsis]|uniref:VWFA domain-containing protein n=1 Tax=Microdochium trichocladiopsis TaxID=1682393 RepID=A0A9P8XU64_9PEZI|nr:uncharacterized protein B0I36DRAFT_34962 [Microdochium trichocladiopsis]KAH7017981.1 hypothetical protein B0I36DRAFT_34962 [Microdochium trichocladiopsis]